MELPRNPRRISCCPRRSREVELICQPPLVDPVVGEDGAAGSPLVEHPLRPPLVHRPLVDQGGGEHGPAVRTGIVPEKKIELYRIASVQARAFLNAYLN